MSWSVLHFSAVFFIWRTFHALICRVWFSISLTTFSNFHPWIFQFINGFWFHYLDPLLYRGIAAAGRARCFYVNISFLCPVFSLPLLWRVLSIYGERDSTGVWPRVAGCICMYAVCGCLWILTLCVSVWVCSGCVLGVCLCVGKADFIDRSRDRQMAGRLFGRAVLPKMQTRSTPPPQISMCILKIHRQTPIHSRV